MHLPNEYTPTERFWLSLLGGFCFLILNGAFFYGMLFQPDSLMASLKNPLSAAFIAEAILLVGLFAYLFARWQISRLKWGWFVVLSLLGGLAFAVPVALLLPRRVTQSK